MISIAKGYSADFESYARSMGVSGMALDRYKATIPSVATGIIKPQDYVNPNIIEERQMNVAVMDVFSRLLMDRIIFINTAINDEMSCIIQAQMLWLEAQGGNDINMYVCSPGGGVYAGFGIIDVMEFIKPNVNTTVTGMAASMGYMISIHGHKRYALKHARLMQHQPLGGAQGQASDIEITAREIGKLKKELYNMISLKTGQPYDKVAHDCDRDYWMIADEAKEYGAIDEVLINRK